MKPISKELERLLKATPKITRKIEAWYDPVFCKTVARITYTENDSTFTQDVDICMGPIVDLTDVWIGGVHIPAGDITFLKHQEAQKKGL
jgi:hypothetical protein